MTTASASRAAEPDTLLARRTTAWDEFLASHHTAGFKQTSWWADLMLSRGWGHFGIVLKDGDSIVGGAQVLTKQLESGATRYYVPHGPVLPSDETDAAEAFQAVLEFIDQRRQADGALVSHLSIEPRWEKMPDFVTGFRQRTGWDEPRNTLYIDLTAPEDAILAQMKQKGRYNIKVARRHGVSIVEDVSPQGLQDFLRLYHATIDRHDLKSSPTTYFEQLVSKFDALGCGSIFFAEHQGEKIAAAVVVYFGNRATYLYGGSLSSRPEVMAPYLLHFSIMLKAKALGFHWYDMYGVAPASESDHEWSGFSAFKRKLGGVDVTFVPSLDYIYDPAAYEQAR